MNGRLGVFNYYDPVYQWEPGTEIAHCFRIRQTVRPDFKKTKYVSSRSQQGAEPHQSFTNDRHRHRHRRR